MKKSKLIVLSFITLLSLIFLNFLFIGNESCSTFMLKHGAEIIFGHNLDMPIPIPGLVVINKRGIYKEGTTWEELTSAESGKYKKVKWTSKFGSVSFNPLGVEFPDGGMNEKGLAIWEMTLSGTEFLRDKSLPRLFMMQWMQYILDNLETVDQVIKSAHEIAIDGWDWHFFTADKSGKCATIEFLNGEPVIHTGENLSVSALCNTRYAVELDRLKRYEGFGGRWPVELNDFNTPRFVHAAYMLKNYDPVKSESIINYGFDILNHMERGGTQWSVILNLKQGDVYFKTSIANKIRRFSLKSFDLSNGKPRKLIDIDSNYDEKREIFKIDGRIVHTQNHTSYAVVDDQGRWTTVLSAAVFVP